MLVLGGKKCIYNFIKTCFLTFGTSINKYFFLSACDFISEIFLFGLFKLKVISVMWFELKKSFFLNRWVEKIKSMNLIDFCLNALNN